MTATRATTDREIIVTRVYDAPRELVFDAFTDPKHLSQWWGPRGFTTTTHSMDFRVGGEWRYTMHGPDGTDYKNLMVYHEINRPSAWCTRMARKARRARRVSRHRHAGRSGRQDRS